MSFRGREYSAFREIDGVQLHLAVAVTAEAGPILVNGCVFTVAFPVNQVRIDALALQIALYRHGPLVGQSIIKGCTADPVGMRLEEQPLGPGIGGQDPRDSRKGVAGL